MSKRRKLPPHIVLPNGQWRFVKRGSKTGSVKNRRVHNMARRRFRRRGGSRGMMGMGGINRLLTPKGALFTLGAAVLAPKIGVSPSVGAAVGALASGAGLIGAGVAFVVAPPVASAAASMVSGLGSSLSAQRIY